MITAGLVVLFGYIITMPVIKKLGMPLAIFMSPILVIAVILASALLPLEMGKHVELVFERTDEQPLASFGENRSPLLVSGSDENGAFYLFATIKDGQEEIHQVPVNEVEIIYENIENGFVVISEAKPKDKIVRYYVVIENQLRYELHVPTDTPIFTLGS